MEIFVQSQLVWLNTVAGDREQAEKELETLIEMREEDQGQSSPHPFTFGVSQGILKRMSDWFDAHPEKGREFALMVVSDANALTQPGSEQRASAMEAVGEWLFEHKFYDDAEPLFVEAIAGYRGLTPSSDKARSDNQKALAAALIHLGDTLTQLGRPTEAEPAIRECIDIRDQVLEPDDRWLIDNARSVLGSCLAAQERYEEAERILLDSYSELRSSILVPADNQRKARERVIDLYVKWGRPDEADKFRAPVKPIDPTTS
jgi:tetratricopeptide (TPR) repeat protein